MDSFQRIGCEAHIKWTIINGLMVKLTFTLTVYIQDSSKGACGCFKVTLFVHYKTVMAISESSQDADIWILESVFLRFSLVQYTPFMTICYTHTPHPADNCTAGELVKSTLLFLSGTDKPNKL